VRAICDKYDVLLIADEVICGFGRTGLWFGQQQWGLRPDIMAFAKGITSGYLQLGGIQVSDAIREVIDTRADGRCVDARLHLLRPRHRLRGGAEEPGDHRARDLLGNSLRMGDRLQSGLEKLLEFPIVGEIRGRGLLRGVDIVKSKETREADPAKAAAIYNACLARGLRTRNVGNALAFAPPLVINGDEVDQIVEILGSVIDGLA
jgi:putrescine aminotransferase